MIAPWAVCPLHTLGEGDESAGCVVCDHAGVVCEGCAWDVHGIGLKCEVVSANRMLEVVHSTAWYRAAQVCSKTRSLNGAHLQLYL